MASLLNPQLSSASSVRLRRSGGALSALLYTPGSLSQKDLGIVASDMAADPQHASLFIPANHTEKDSKVQKQIMWHKLRGDLVLDLFILACLVVITASLESAEPRAVYLIKDTLWRHSYPYKDNSVPSWTVPLYSILAPLLAFALHKIFFTSAGRNNTWLDWYRVSLAAVYAVLLTAAITNSIKVAIGRPRPNFVFRCWPDGVIKWESETQFGGYPNCTNPPHIVNEHRKSFPSGHSSWSAAGLGFLSLWLMGQTRAFSGYCHVWRVCFSLIPAAAALVVGITRITDYWHHVSDVCVGLSLGYFVAFVFYVQLFPWFSHANCDVPLTDSLHTRVSSRYLAAARGPSAAADLSGGSSV